MKRLLSHSLIVILLCCCITPVLVHAQGEATPYYSIIQSLSADLLLDEQTGNATCIGSVQATYGTAVSVTVELQVLEGNRWKVLQSWENSRTSFVKCSGNCTIEAGHTYRTYVIGYTMDADGNITESGHTSKSYDYPA